MRELDQSTSPGPLDEVWARLLVAARVLIPSTLLASLFYYFGLRYTDYQYREYGLDDAALGYSASDYVVRSLNVTVQPARVLLGAVLIAAAFHFVIVALTGEIERRWPNLSDNATKATGVTLVALGTIGLYFYWSPGRIARDPVALSAGWLISIVLVAYGAHLACVRVRRRDHIARPIDHAVAIREPLVVTIVVAVMLMLVAYGAFEFTRLYAHARAYQQSLQIERTPSAFPLVHIYSRFDLALDDRLDIVETKLDGNQDDFRYRYDGLRLFLQDNGRLVLWPTHQSPRTGMFILIESDDLRVEYEPDRQIEPQLTS